MALGLRYKTRPGQILSPKRFFDLPQNEKDPLSNLMAVQMTTPRYLKNEVH